MRLAFLRRHWAMQFGRHFLPSSPSPSLSQNSRKRSLTTDPRAFPHPPPFRQQNNADTFPAKAPRSGSVETPQEAMRAFGSSPKRHLSGAHDSRQGSRSGKNKKVRQPGGSSVRGSSSLALPRVIDPVHDAEYINRVHRKVPLKNAWEQNPKSPLSNFLAQVGANPPVYQHEEVKMRGAHGWRATIEIKIDGGDGIVGVGDSVNKTESEQLAALSALHQLNALGKLDAPRKVIGASTGAEAAQPPTLSDGTVVTYERSRQFMDHYCRRFGFGKPDISYDEQKPRQGHNLIWEAVMYVGGRRIGIGTGANKKAALTNCYVDATQYLESCDPALWETFSKEAAEGKDLGMGPRVLFQMSEGLEDDVRDLCADIQKSTLYQNRPSVSTHLLTSVTFFSQQHHHTSNLSLSSEARAAKSLRLSRQMQSYLKDPLLESMRSTRNSLPVYTRAADILSCIRENEVTICMAATGSGKTTQIPQLILDDYVSRGNGASCNIICTQPRRLAAISVADRVAKERGESIGSGSIGYQVRFEAKLPDPHGSITFCTTGIFLKRMQSALQDNVPQGYLDDITHVVVDEVHERDVDTDLLLVVLKRLLADRKAKGKPLKVVLMSATIDPTLFRLYFPDGQGRPAKVIEVPGRSFPVEQHFLDDFITDLSSDPHASLVFAEESVSKYLHRELGPDLPSAIVGYLQAPVAKRPAAEAGTREDDLELPYPLIALAICHVLQRSEDGHVLVFLPGWDEIQALNRQLLERRLGLPLYDPTHFSIHLLHSSIPIAEQQLIFDPPPPGVRRIILSTNIAETSVTIPDVVYVVDAARVKEQRYDPARHMSSLVSAWVGSSNLKQRAGRAGRHRPGEYFGILGRKRAEGLHPYQVVEMKRVDLTNVVMHVKALDFPGMAVEEVLAAAIEPPAPDRIEAAMSDLQMVGAIDDRQNLTPLGRVLLQLPVDVQVGRLVLYGSFFRCLDQALTLAALMTNREPFVSPMHRKAEAAAAKNTWSAVEFRSDALAALRAYNAWWRMQSRGEYVSANRFCSENFLSKPTLLMVDRIKKQLLASLQHAGVLDVSAGGRVEPWGRGGIVTVPPELNDNGDSEPLLAALIAIALQPKFAIRTGESIFRTKLDKTALIHPSSVNNRKRDVSVSSQDGKVVDKQIIAYAEKRQNISMPGSSSSAPMFLVTTTKLDPMTYVLFGAHQIAVTAHGLECDEWLPIVGNVYTLDDIQRLKVMMEACMSRVFEGLAMRRTRFARRTVAVSPREEEESGDEEDARGNLKDYSLSPNEVKELDCLTRDIVSVLNRYATERMETQSRTNSRPATPMDSPSYVNAKLPQFGTRSGTSTPYGVRSAYNSRPGTPSRLSRAF